MVGLFIGVLLLVGGLFTVNVLENKIVVSLPSDVCNAATLRVTKDDFTLKCGRRIAFQADTIVEYYKTYGTDEWVRNNRFVGANKKHITLELNDYDSYFDIIRKTRYRKGRQNIDDGVLYETYTFTKDKVKISYNYEVNNKALHRISMRIKKQVDSYLDASDPNGYTGVLSNNILSYKGYSDLVIDPLVTLTSPTNITHYREGDSVPFICNCSVVGNASFENLTNMSFYWNARNELDWHVNDTTVITGNTSTTYTKVIPHPTVANFSGTFKWNCECCQTSNCTFQTNNWTLDALYKPEVPAINFPNMTNVNFFNGSLKLWGAYDFYPGVIHDNNTELNNTIYINFSYPGIRDNGTIGCFWNLSYYGSTNTTMRVDNLRYNYTSNASTSALFNVSNLVPDLYYVVARVCNALNLTLCENDTMDIPIDVFDYDINISTGESKIRFSPQPTINLGAALGQTPSQGIISIDWDGYRQPDGIINLSMNFTSTHACMTLAAHTNGTASSATTLPNNTYVVVMNASDADPDYIWLWANKTSCPTSTQNFTLVFDLAFGGNLTVGR